MSLHEKLGNMSDEQRENGLAFGVAFTACAVIIACLIGMLGSMQLPSFELPRLSISIPGEYQVQTVPKDGHIPVVRAEVQDVVAAG